MKYRIMEKDGIYRIQKSRFGIFWTWGRTLRDRIFETEHLGCAQDTIAATKEYHARRPKRWKEVGDPT